MRATENPDGEVVRLWRSKPEPLKHEFKDYWSRRIDQKHRLVYRATADTILIAQARFHF